MAEKLTPQQAQAVENRGGKLLVAAAAGSGKTKVLVDRLMGYLLDPRDPANLDDFLIITYTKAAAAELRGKIASKLNAHIAASPENRHLQQQMQRLYLTEISTVHAFCADLLREYAYKLDLAPDFRVADENECRELRDTVMTRVLENAYENAATDPDFCAFVDTQGLGRDDRLVPEILLKVFDSARCHLNPGLWLDSCIENAQATGKTDAGQTLWGQFLMEDLYGYLELQIAAMERCATLAAQAEQMEKPAALLSDTVYQLRTLRDSKTWDELLRNKDIDYGRLVISKKCPDQALGERIKAIRNGCKKGLERKLKSFADPSVQVLADLEQSAAAARGMIALVRTFDKEYDRTKRSRRILDFGDLEHRTLDLLLGKNRTGFTAAAQEAGRRFREIMVDEYQDSNAVQDAIFEALTRQRNNCFMVGDVKQSIYQFRLADPGIFLKKYNAYAPAETAAPDQGRKVLLSANFRSGGAVLSAVNDIFSLCMSEKVGGLTYGPEEALREGIPHEPLGEPEVELLAVDVREDTYAEEAAFVAHRIRQLLDGSHFVRGDQGLRPIQPEDIAILLRSPGSVGRHFQTALETVGIRCSTGGGEDLLQTQEIASLRALLQTISNPRQDIPLIAVLASPIFAFTADELAAFRSRDKRSNVYDALLLEETEKARSFRSVLDHLRRTARMHTLAQLLEEIFALTQLDSVFAAMDGGKVRLENLQAFYHLAVDFEANGRRDLNQFLEHLDAISEKGLIAAGQQTASGAVTLMSIHKSKGLEFPVVFVCGLARAFNQESSRAQVLCHKALGLGLATVDETTRVRYPTISKRAIAVKTQADSLSEEMRVLYVALTRARDRLIMTYASDNLAGDLADIALRRDLGGMDLLTRDVQCPGQWVLMAAMNRTEAGAFFNLAGKPDETTPGTPAWNIQVVQAPELAGSGCGLKGEKLLMPQGLANRIASGLAFTYPHGLAAEAPSKQTATQRKGRIKDQEAAENTREHGPWQRSWRQPAFVEAKLQGKDRGSAIHAALQYIRYDSCTSEAEIRQEVRRLMDERFLSPGQGELVDCAKLSRFFATELGQKLIHGQVLREFKFSILDDGSHFDPALSGEQILLQGVVDCALLEADGITVVDFKTDYVTQETLPLKTAHYLPQVQAYADALNRIYQQPIKARYLYFFHLDRLVEL